MPGYAALQVNARGEATVFPAGERYLLGDLDDPVVFFRAKRRELIERGITNDDPLYAHVAADTTHNCNLRCRFCPDDFSQATRDRMTEEDFLKLLSLAELVWNGGIFLSCLYEPFLHPRFTHLLRLVPEIGRDKCFFTTNLCFRRFRPEELEAVAEANLNYINISVDSLTRGTYEALRVNADYDVFRQNLDALTNTFRIAARPPQLRFITVALRSNYAEILDLARIAREEYGVAQYEVRLPFSMPYAPADWAKEQSLTAEEWARLEDRLMTLPFPIKVVPTGATSRYYPAPVPGLFI